MKKTRFIFLLTLLLAGAALGGLTGGVLFSPQTAGAQDGESLESSLYEVVDANGNPKIQLGIDNDGQPILMLLDDNGSRREVMSQSEDGTPIFIMIDGGDAPRLIFGVDEESGGLLEMYNKKKALSWSARK